VHGPQGQSQKKRGTAFSSTKRPGSMQTMRSLRYTEWIILQVLSPSLSGVKVEDRARTQNCAHPWTAFELDRLSSAVGSEAIF